MAFSLNCRLIAVASLLAVNSTGLASAACTVKDQEVKTAQLSDLMTPLSQKDPPRAQKVSEETMSAMTLEGDAACAKLDELIAKAK